MMNTWSVKKLQEICDVFADGDWIESKDQATEGIRLIQTGNVGNGLFKDRVEKARYISQETFKRLRCTEILEGDCLVSRLPDPVGRACILPDTGERMITAVDCTIIRFTKNTLFPDFFNYYAQSSRYLQDVNTETTGTTRTRISRKNLGEIFVPVPSLTEQQRIVTLLDEAFESIATARANAEKNLQNARALFESHLESVFTQRGDGWTEKTLGDPSIVQIVDGDRGANYPNKEEYSEKGYCLFLNTKNVRPDGFNFDSTMFISEEKDRALRKGKLKRGDVILTTRGTIGNIAVYDENVDFENVRINSGMLIFRPNSEKLLSSFLFEIFRSGIMKNQMVRYVSGAAQPQLPIRTLVNFVIPVPNTLNEQGQFVKNVRNIAEQTEHLESIYQQKIAALDELKKSLLHRAFSGQL